MATLSGLRRVAAAVAVALAAYAGGPGLGIAPAYADDEGGDGAAAVPTVSFVGGSLLNLIVCRSQPSRSALAVAPESRVMFVNRLGQDAVLRVDGRPVVHVGPGQAAPLVFHHGPVSVSMTFACGAPVMEQFLATTVSVAAGTRTRPADAAPSPTTGTRISPPSGAARSRPVASAAAGAGKGAPANAGPGNAGPGNVGPGNVGHAALSPAQPAGTAAPAAPDRSDTANAGPSAVDRSPVPADAPVADRPSVSPPDSDAVGVEPLVRAADSSPDTSSTLLASIVAIFVIGVTITAIRVIISKRTIRTPCA